MKHGRFSAGVTGALFSNGRLIFHMAFGIILRTIVRLRQPLGIYPAALLLRGVRFITIINVNFGVLRLNWPTGTFTTKVFTLFNV